MNALPLLADLGLERSADAERGLTALALIATTLALFTAFRAIRAAPALAPTRHPPQRGAEAAWRIVRGIGQLAAGIAVVFALNHLLRPTPARPAGWGLLQPPRECSALALHDGRLWVGGREGLFAFDPATRAPVPLPPLDLRGTRTLLAEGGVLWIGSSRGLSRWREGRLESVRPPGVADLGPVSIVRRVRSGGLWIGVRGGLWELAANGADWRFLGPKEGVRLPTVDVIHETRDGRIWLASNEPEAEGLLCARGDTWERFGRAEGLPSTAVNDLAEDAAGVLWVGTGFGLHGGAARWDGTRWEPVRIGPLADQKIRSLHLDAVGRLWFCSEYDGVAFQETDGRWRHLSLADGLPGNEVKRQLQTPSGTLWLATERGLGFMLRLP